MIMKGKKIDHEAKISYTGSLSRTNISLDSGYFYSFFIGYPTVKSDSLNYENK